jgi:hypothetical protein
MNFPIERKIYSAEKGTLGVGNSLSNSYLENPVKRDFQSLMKKISRILKAIGKLCWKRRRKAKNRTMDKESCHTNLFFGSFKTSIWKCCLLYLH